MSIGNNTPDTPPGNTGETNPVSLKEQGNRLFQEGDYQGAISWYDMALFADPGYRDALHNKRLCLLKLGLKDRARSVQHYSTR